MLENGIIGKNLQWNLNNNTAYLTQEKCEHENNASKVAAILQVTSMR